MAGFCPLKCEAKAPFGDLKSCFACVAAAEPWCGENVWDQHCIAKMGGKCSQSCGTSADVDDSHSACQTSCVCSIDHTYCCSASTFDQTCENIQDGYCKTVCDKVGTQVFDPEPMISCFDDVASFDQHCQNAVWDEYCWQDAGGLESCKPLM